MVKWFDVLCGFVQCLVVAGFCLCFLVSLFTLDLLKLLINNI